MHVPQHPYQTQPARSFWRTSVANRHYADLCDLWRPLLLVKKDRIATAGSCFAQHIGNNLNARGAAFMDMEPLPIIFNSSDEARKWGYGVFSCRYGNIYNTRQLLQLFYESHDERTPTERVWEKQGRFFDALRPSVDPVGQNSAEAVLALRARHLLAVRRMFAELDLFIFTMGLTECWENTEDGTIFSLAPGTLVGKYDPLKYKFRNLRAADIRNDMLEFWKQLRIVNPRARMLLTVSPVPLAATYTQNHILAATTYSKSVLRAAAGELAEDIDDIHYFPSYEIISSHPSRGMFFEPDQRNVNMFGVDYVMSHFFSGPLSVEFGGQSVAAQIENFELICDEHKLDQSV
jgi:hypothetical protein